MLRFIVSTVYFLVVLTILLSLDYVELNEEELDEEKEEDLEEELEVELELEVDNVGEGFTIIYCTKNVLFQF